MKVAVRGEGVAAACCAALLAKASIVPSIQRVSRPPAPVVMLSDPALALLRDVLDRPDLWAALPRIERRIVAWGSSDPVTVPHAATIVTGVAMNGALDCFLDNGVPAAAADFTIHTASPVPFGQFRRFGSREASAVSVALRHADDRSACWIEAVAEGWLFLIPAAGDQAWLLGVGQPIDMLLGQSRLIALRIGPADGPVTTFGASPGMLVPPRAADGLACGGAGIAFDPICGDGTAQAAREAILAAAVVAGIGEGGDAEALMGHYEAMLTAAMRRHLMMCMDYYRSGGDAPWWRAQFADLADGHRWCTLKLSRTPEPRFLLMGDRLVAREVAA